MHGGLMNGQIGGIDFRKDARMTATVAKEKCQRRKMPSKKAILAYWTEIGMFDAPTSVNSCWGCGFTKITQRCHIVDRCSGGSDVAENLVLLCIHCHQMQETMCRSNAGAELFKSQILESAPFMTAGWARESELFRCKYGVDVNSAAFGITTQEQHTLGLIRQLRAEGESMDSIISELMKERTT